MNRLFSVVSGFAGLAFAGSLIAVPAAVAAKQGSLPEPADEIAPELAELIEANRFAVATALVEGGLLRITGTTKGKNKKVRLDGVYETRSGADRVFSFEIVYLPDDCIGELAAEGKKIDAVIQGCGAAGPVGDDGPRGKRGKRGTRGNTGPEGPMGDTGLAGPAGPEGDAGADGPAGPQGAPGIVQILQDTDTNAVAFDNTVAPGAPEASGCDVTITTTGGPVMAVGTLPVFIDYPGNGQIAANILRDGANVDFDYRWVQAIPNLFGGYQTAHVQWHDAPTAGTYTYTLQLTFSNISGDLNNTYPCILTVTEHQP